MDQTVNTVPEIDKCAVIHQGLHSSFRDQADFDIGDALGFFAVPALAQDIPRGQYQLLAFLLGGYDANRNGLTLEYREILNVIQCQLRSGDKCTDAVQVSDYAAFHDVGDTDFRIGFIILHGLKFFPCQLFHGISAGKQDIAAAVIRAEHDGFYGIADFDIIFDREARIT